MPIRVKWDKYETALLIETFWKIEKTPSKKAEYISELSEQLREKAIRIGLDIDDIYRNVNGITMQLSPIAHAFFPERPTLTTSKMFQKMVELYNNDPKEFNAILKEAHEMVGDSSDKQVDMSAIEREIEDILVQHYPYGFNISSPIENMRFRNYYEAKYSKSLELSDDDFETILLQIGIQVDNKIIIISDDIKNKIRQWIITAKNNQMIIIYYDDFFTCHFDQLHSNFIVSSDMLKSVLQIVEKKGFYKKSYMLLTEENSTEASALNRQIQDIWGDDRLLSFGDIKERLPYVPLQKIKFALSKSDDFVWNSFETYYPRSCFSLSEMEVEIICERACEQCDSEGSVSLSEVISEDLRNNYFELTEIALCDLVFPYLIDKFDRNGNAIFYKGQAKKLEDAIKDYCEGKDCVAYEDLENIMQSTTGKLRQMDIIEYANAVMIRVSAEQFVSDKSIQFEVDVIDGLLDELVDEEIGMKQISNFGGFPHCGKPWNLFLMESYCRRFSRKYKYLCLTPNNRNAGAIVKKDADYSYDEIMIHALAKSKIELNEKNAFDYLLDAGYISRRQLVNIENIINSAIKMRGRR